MSARCLIVVVIFGLLFIEAGSAEAQHHRSGYGGGGYAIYPAWGFGYPGWGYGGYGYGFGLQGWSPGGIFMGMGQFNQLTSQAAVNYQQAYSMALDNRLKAEQTYFQARRDNASARAEMAAMRPHYTPEQYAAANHARIPGRLLPSEWDPGRGVFVWPPSLASDEFAADRAQIEALFGARGADPSAAGLGTANYREIKQAVTMMADHLHSLIHQMSPDEYIPASKFLKGLEHEARFAPSAARASAD